MKNAITLSSKQWIFVALGVLYSIAALPLLLTNWNNNGALANLDGQLGPNAFDAYIGVAYAVALTLSAVLLRKSDNPRAAKNSLALQYHLLAAMLASLFAGVYLVFLVHFNWRYVVWVLAIGWGTFGLHWLQARRSPKGIAAHTAFK